jgi:FtsP/CotA-like multicopper oxidase with cupredoxin domain
MATLPLSVRWQIARGAQAAAGLSDPSLQPKFAYPVPDALSPAFKFQPNPQGGYKVSVAANRKHLTGLVGKNGRLLKTPIFGYSDGDTPTWPGKTFEVSNVASGGPDQVSVHWANDLFLRDHPLPVDTSRHTDYQFDGNPEFFYSPDAEIRGPQWDYVAGGFTQEFHYDNDVPAGNLWYHDHALGITRLNVYAGLAGFYFVRDGDDTGLAGNPLGLPAWPYEKAYAIQDRMFHDTGDLFYSAYPGDPFYDDFITGEGAVLPPDLFPGGGPTALAEFFGDHIVVNGIIWPYEAVEPRNYRLHLLNGTDSRFMVVRFRAVDAGATDLEDAGAPIPFNVIGSDQGLASAATEVDTLVFEPGARYDIVFDFKGLQGKRIVMENIGGDAPFGGDFGDALAPEDFFPDRQTDRIMAFDVANVPDVTDGFDPGNIGTYAGNNNSVDRTRKVALFEGMDEFGRLQPLLGSAEPTVDAKGDTVNGSIAWHDPTTENPGLGDTEVWEIYNATGDAHPVHLHLVNFEVLGRQEFEADAIEQPVLQHNGEEGTGFRLENIELGAPVAPLPGYVENAPKDMVTALPDQVTSIKATFDKPGRYVWHCHILSHEDHEMMRVLHVGPGA